MTGESTAWLRRAEQLERFIFSGLATLKERIDDLEHLVAAQGVELQDKMEAVNNRVYRLEQRVDDD